MFILGFFAGAGAIAVALLIANYFADSWKSGHARRALPATARAIRKHERSRRLRLGVAPSRWLDAPRDGERP
jgi:hypothetical protein